MSLVSKQEFENLVYLESDFFNLGLKLGQRNGTISADKQINVSIYAPEDVLMMAGLEYADGAAAGDGYTFCQRDGERYDIYAQFPARRKLYSEGVCQAEETIRASTTLFWNTGSMLPRVGAPAFP